MESKLNFKIILQAISVCILCSSSAHAVNETKIPDYNNILSYQMSNDEVKLKNLPWMSEEAGGFSNLIVVVDDVKVQEVAERSDFTHPNRQFKVTFTEYGDISCSGIFSPKDKPEFTTEYVAIALEDGKLDIQEFPNAQKTSKDDFFRSLFAIHSDLDPGLFKVLKMETIKEDLDNSIKKLCPKTRADFQEKMKPSLKKVLGTWKK